MYYTCELCTVRYILITSAPYRHRWYGIIFSDKCDVNQTRRTMMCHRIYCSSVFITSICILITPVPYRCARYGIEVLVWPIRYRHCTNRDYRTEDVFVYSNSVHDKWAFRIFMYILVCTRMFSMYVCILLYRQLSIFYPWLMYYMRVKEMLLVLLKYDLELGSAII